MALYAAYAFNEGGGTTVIDYSGNGFNLTVTGTPTWTNPGHGSYATSFQSDFSTGGAVYNAGSFISALGSGATTMCWYQNIATGTTEQFICGLFGSPGFARMSLYGFRNLFGTQGAPEATTRDSAGGINSTGAGTTADSGVWHHAACTFDTTNNITLYLDGVQVATSTASNSGGLGVNVQYIGAGAALSGGDDQCWVQDMRVFTTALTQSDIVTYMNTPVVSGNITISGVVSPVTVSAPSGVSSLSVVSAVSSVSATALAGIANETITGTTSAVSSSAQPGTVNESVSGATSTVQSQANAGITKTTITTATSAVAVSSQAGIVNVTVSGTVTNIAASAIAGSVIYTSTIHGVTAVSTVEAIPGTVMAGVTAVVSRWRSFLLRSGPFAHLKSPELRGHIV